MAEPPANVFSPWFNLTDELMPPDGFDPAMAAEDALSDQAEAVASTSFQHGYLPLTDLPLDDSVASLTGVTEPAFLYEAQEYSLPYGLTSWPMSYAPRELIADFKRQRRLNRIGFLRGTLELTESVAYYDNVFGASTGQKSDMVFAFRPLLYIEAGTKGRAQFVYSPEFVRFSKYSQLNSSNQQFAFRVRYPFSKLNLAADAFYLNQTGLFLENNSGGLAELHSIIGRISAEYPLTDKTSVRIGGEIFRQNSDPGGSQIDNSVSLDGLYKFTESTTGGGGVVAGAFSSPAGDQTYVKVQLNGSYQPYVGLRFTGEAGLQVRHFDFPVQQDNPLPIPVFTFQVDWNPSSTASFNVRIYRSVLNTTFTDLSLAITTAATTSMLLHLYEKVNVQFEMGIGYSEQLSGFTEDNDGFYFALANLRASYPLLRWMDVEIFNNFQQRLGDADGNNYISNISGVALTLKF